MKSFSKPTDFHKEKLEEYARVLFEWNQAIRLTGFRTLKDIREKLVDESILVARHFGIMDQSAPIIDFGSGNGTPGIVFAILNSSVKIALVDRKSKKRSFLIYLAGRLDLKNVSIFSELTQAFDHFSGEDDISLWMKGISIESLHDAPKHRERPIPLPIHVYKFGLLDQNKDCNHIRLHAITSPDENNEPFKEVEIYECDFRPKWIDFVPRGTK